MNADAFLTYVTRVLVPEPEPGRGDVVIMDNLSSHTRCGRRIFVLSAGIDQIA